MSISARRPFFEQLERREVFAPLPVLMVIADQRDFFYQEYGDTKISLEETGLTVRVAATTTRPSTPHGNSGQGATSGIVTPDLTLASVVSTDYSAIVFVGGWGSSMYQYSFTGNYYDDHYDGNAATRTVVNNLINQFSSQNKYIAAVCHATTVLAWARVNGVSPLQGKTVSVPYQGSPGVFWNGTSYSPGQLQQHVQMTANGATPRPHGSVGNPATDADDVTVDGRIITGENNFSAREFGRVIATRLWAEDVPPNVAPVVTAATWQLNENSAAGTAVGQVAASDANAGQTLSYSLLNGNTAGAFAVNSATGQITVANAGALDFETNPIFQLTVRATDNATPALSGQAVVTVQLRDVNEFPAGPVSPVGNDLVLQGTPNADNIQISTNPTGQVLVSLGGVLSGPYTLPAGGRFIVRAGNGDDRIQATSSAIPVVVYGEGGNDLIFGSPHDDLLSGGEGNDRILGFAGDDLLLGGADRDLLDGGSGEDLLIGGTTSYDNNQVALQSILAEWTSNASAATRRARLNSGIAGGVRLALGATVHADEGNGLLGGAGLDWILASTNDKTFGSDSYDVVTNARNRKERTPAPPVVP